MWLSVAICIGGLIYRIRQLFKLTSRKAPELCPLVKPRDPAAALTEEQKLERMARFQVSILGKHPVMTVASFVFHLCLVAVPLFIMAHNLMLRNAVGVRLPAVPEGLGDVLTVVVLAFGAFFLVRRLAVPKVAAISDYRDYAVLALTMAPFLTGFLAHHQVLPYRAMVTLHALTGDVMLAAIPLTKIGHMVFFFFARLTLASEFSFGRGSRVWAEGAR